MKERRQLKTLVDMARKEKESLTNSLALTSAVMFTSYYLMMFSLIICGVWLSLQMLGAEHYSWPSIVFWILGTAMFIVWQFTSTLVVKLSTILRAEEYLRLMDKDILEHMEYLKSRCGEKGFPFDEDDIDWFFHEAEEDECESESYLTMNRIVNHYITEYEHNKAMRGENE